jgi:1-acyl-sn-glycerol-3-phosphate acyltransferase
MPWFYYLGRIIVWMSFLILTRWQVNGRENVPSQGPLLIVANHLHLVDPPLLGISLQRKIIFMAKEELFHSKFLSYFIRRLGSFPVHRGRLDREALQQADQVLARGLALVIFPEGMRSKNGKLQPAFRGSALIALRSSAPILPIGITGTDKIRGAAWVLRRPRVIVNIGKPFYLPPVSDKLIKTEMDKLTGSIMGCIAQLLPPEYRGDYTREGN